MTKDLFGVLTTPEAESIMEQCLPGMIKDADKDVVELMLYLVKEGWRAGYVSAVDRVLLNLRAEEKHDAADIVLRIKG